MIKVLPDEMAGQVSMDRFRREITLAAQLQHPHIVPLLSAGEVGGLPYFTMPYVRGESLRARLASHGEMPIHDAIRMLREVASALASAHDQGVVHRDIKPDNVLLSGGAAMVTDFGVAKALDAAKRGERPEGGSPKDLSEAESLTSMDVALGTPAYMAPEQASADPNTDSRARPTGRSGCRRSCRRWTPSSRRVAEWSRRLRRWRRRPSRSRRDRRVGEARRSVLSWPRR